MSIPVSGLNVVVNTEADKLVVVAVGEIDLFTISSFEPPVMKVISDVIAGDDHRQMAIDLTDVEFIDSCCLALLLRACHSMRDAGHEFCLMLGRDTQPARVLRLGRFDTLMAMHYVDDLNGALSLASTPI